MGPEILIFLMVVFNGVLHGEQQADLTQQEAAHVELSELRR